MCHVTTNAAGFALNLVRCQVVGSEEIATLFKAELGRTFRLNLIVCILQRPSPDKITGGIDSLRAGYLRFCGDCEWVRESGLCANGRVIRRLAAAVRVCAQGTFLLHRQ